MTHEGVSLDGMPQGVRTVRPTNHDEPGPSEKNVWGGEPRRTTTNHDEPKFPEENAVPMGGALRDLAEFLRSV
jgi:hypothetical protein